jgi:hypothetical protein
MVKTVAVIGSFAAAGVVWWILEVIWPGRPYHYLRLWLPLVMVPYWIAAELFVSHRYGIDLTARTTTAKRQALASRRQRWGGPLRLVFGYILAPVMLAVALLIGIGILRPFWDAAHGGGSVGQLTLTDEDCSSGDCTWNGIFLADDHRYYYSGIEMEDPIRDAAVGISVSVRYEDSLGDAFAMQGSRAYIPLAWTTAICGAYGVGGILLLGIHLARRRRRRAEITPV